jgi:glycosyltransferase involved in cell wall biosynthesis
LKNLLSIIILTFNEQKHIERCIASLTGVARKVFVVDSFSTDDTVKITRALGAEIVQRTWKNYADQFQWGVDQANATDGWVMRMDADEYLEPDLQKEIQEVLPTLPEDVIGVYLKRKVFFHGKWIRYGGFYPHTLLRIWRAGQGRIEQRWMDEHIVLPPNAKTVKLKEHLVDDNQKGITFWIDKHNRYASREMADILIQKYFPSHGDHALRKMNADPQARWKRFIKEEVYNKLPPGLRAALYFFYRYILLFGFLDGSKGFIYHFLQGFWYRLLVDVKLIEVEEKAKGDPRKIKEILYKEYGIEI